MSPTSRPSGSPARFSRTSSPKIRRGPAPHKDRLAMVHIEIDLPEEVWLKGFTHDHPNLLVELHNILVVPNQKVLADVEIRPSGTDWKDEIATFPDVEDVVPLEVPPETGRYRVLSQESRVVSVIVELEILLRYPTRAKNGVVSFETVDQISRIRSLVATLRSRGFRPRIVSLRKEFFRSREPSMTAVQRAMFRDALESGYFDVPRRITLTQLAQKLSRSKSTVSETLAVVERKLAEAAAASTK